MKKIITIGLSLFLLVSMVCCSVLSVGATTNSSEKITSPNVVQLGKGETIKLSVSTTNSNLSKIYARSFNTSIATINFSSSVSNKIAKFNVTGKKTGTATFKFCKYSLVDGGESNDATTKVVVSNAPTTINLNYDTIKLGKGETITLSETTNSGSYANAQNLKWTVSSSNGKISSLGNGKAKLTGNKVGKFKATVTAYNGVWDSAGVTVYNAPKSVRIGNSNGSKTYSTPSTTITLTKGKSYTFACFTNSGSYANPKNIFWHSTNSKVATVTKGSANKATIKAVSKGTSFIAVRLYNDVYAACYVKVK